MKRKSTITPVEKNAFHYFEDYFLNNSKKWEEKEVADEYAKIHDGAYQLINRSNIRWHYYEKKCAVLRGRQWKIEASFKCNSTETSNQFGLVWGFDKHHDVLNRFSLAADGKAFSIVCFERNHHRIYHRFYSGDMKLSTKIYFKMSIERNIDYFYFKIDGCILYVCHAVHFLNFGNRFGFYIEPDLSVQCNHVICTKLEALDETRQNPQPRFR
jgi:hypothetical protein